MLLNSRQMQLRFLLPLIVHLRSVDAVTPPNVTTTTANTSIATTSASISQGSAQFTTSTTLKTAITATPTATPYCDINSFSYAPTSFSGVLNQDNFAASISLIGSSANRTYARNMTSGYEIGCGVPTNNSLPFQKVAVYFNVTGTSSNTANFMIASNKTRCYLAIYTSCSQVPLVNTIGANNRTGYLFWIPGAINMTTAITSASGIAGAADACRDLISSVNASTAAKLNAVGSIASNIQAVSNNTSSNATNVTASLQSTSGVVLQQLSSVVGNSSQTDLAASASLVINSVNTLVNSVSTNSASVAQAASVLSAVLQSVANTSSSGFSMATGNNVASTVATILQNSANSTTSVTSSINLLSQIAVSQAMIGAPVTYSDPAGLVSVQATVTLSSNFGPVTNANNSMNTGTAFKSLLAGLSTTTVTSQAVSLAINPYAATKADSANSSRTGVFQFSLFDDSNNPISVQNLATNFSMTFAMTPDMWKPAFANATVVPACQYWSTANLTWQTDGCYFDTVNSNSTVGICNCNHLTAFSVSLASIVPNNLDPVADAANAAHAGLIYLVTGFMTLIWMASMYYAWNNNKHQVLAANGLVVDDFAAYKVSIRTDNNLQSSTTARTYLTIHGTESTSERFMFHQGMKAGYKIEKTIIALNVGPIQSLSLSHDGTGSMVNWKVGDLTIHNVATGAGLTINTPFSVPQAGVELTGTQIRGESTFYKRFHNQVMVNMQDRHLWLSTVTAPDASRFSHTERLATCFLLFFGNMGLGFWFHKTRSFTQDFLNVIIVAIITSGIMLAITLPLMWILRSAKNQTASDGQDAERNMEGSVMQKGPSIGWRYLTWIMTGLVTMAAIGLCCLAALDLDAKNVSSLTAALQSTVISLAESFFISSPLIAIGRSWWTAIRGGARNTELSTDMNKSGKPQAQNDDQLIQATSTLDQQWSPESIYPPIPREPTLMSTNLSNATVPRNKAQRASALYDQVI